MLQQPLRFEPLHSRNVMSIYRLLIIGQLLEKGEEADVFLLFP